MVFPFAVHFAEAHGHPFYALPFNRFVIHKTGLGFESHASPVVTRHGAAHPDTEPAQEA